MKKRPVISETANNYGPVIHQYGRFRVVPCKHAIQWCIQRQKGGPGSDWRGEGYCRTRDGLLACWLRLAGESDQSVLLALPDRIEGGAL